MNKGLLIQILKSLPENKPMDMEFYTMLVQLPPEKETLLKEAIVLTKNKNISLLWNLIKNKEEEEIFYETMKRLESLEGVSEEDKQKLFAAPILQKGIHTWNQLIVGLSENKDKTYIQLFTNPELLKRDAIWEKLNIATYGKTSSPFLCRLFTNPTLLAHETLAIALEDIYIKTSKDQNNLLFDALADRINSDSLGENETNWVSFVEHFIKKYDQIEKQPVDAVTFEKNRTDLFHSFIAISEARELMRDADNYEKALQTLSATLPLYEDINIIPDLNYQDVLTVLMNPLYYQSKESYQELCDKIILNATLGRKDLIHSFLHLLDLPRPLSRTEVEPILKQFDFDMDELTMKAYLQVAENDALRIYPEKRNHALDLIIKEKDPKRCDLLVKLLCDENLLSHDNLRNLALKEAKVLTLEELESIFPILTCSKLIENEKRYQKAVRAYISAEKKSRKTGQLRKMTQLRLLLTDQELLQKEEAYDYILRKLGFVIDKQSAFPYLFAANDKSLQNIPEIWRKTLEKIASTDSYEQGLAIYCAVGEVLEKEKNLREFIQDQGITPSTLLSYLEKVEDKDIGKDTPIEPTPMIKVLTSIPSKERNNHKNN